jgi:hypothetical protein
LFVFARIAAFEGGDVERLRQFNQEQMDSGELGLPDGVSRALVLQGDQRLFITFFDSREALDAAGAEFERMGDVIPEDIRGRRVSVDAYEVVWDSTES